MKVLQYSILFLFGFLFFCCGSPTTLSNQSQKENPVVIANDSLEYEIIIIEPGFNLFLQSVAQPEGFYSQVYLENKNLLYVSNYNIRVNQPFRYNPNIYENLIDYNSNVNYGYDVNYKLFNYFEFIQRKYRMNL